MIENDGDLLRSVSFYKGQYRITIPKQIAQALNIRNKDKLKIFIDKGDIILQKI